MTTARLDRRVQRTRQQLRDALIALILERGCDTLTIQDITDRADLRRATFYMHYGTKEELLLTILQETFDGLVRQLEPMMKGDALGGKTQVDVFRVTFQHVAANSALYRIILGGQGAAAIARSIREYLAGCVLRGLKTVRPDRLTMPPDVLANYIAGAELGLMTWWLENGQPYPAERMAEMAHQLILDGVLRAVK
jgi:AcrR family transcriptional regulator